MKFKVSKNSLLAACRPAASAIATKPIIPILHNLMLHVEPGRLSVTGTDLENTVFAFAPIEGGEPGEITVPAAILIKTIEGLPEQELVVEIKGGENLAMVITAHTGEYRIAAESAKDFPVVPVIDDEATEIKVQSQDMEKGLSKTMFAITRGSDGVFKPALTGIFFDTREGDLKLVATDSARLSSYTIGKKDIRKGEMESFIVPKRTAALLKNNLNEDKEIKIFIDDKNALFSGKNAHVMCRLIDAGFPNYRAIIPTENDKFLTLNRKGFLSILNRAAVYTDGTYNQIKIDVAEKEIEVTAQAVGLSNTLRETMPCSYKGEPLQIGMNALMLLDIVKVMEADSIVMTMKKASTPVLMQECNEEGVDPLLVLIMPVILHNND